ncbi:UDP-N-acetylmuramoyl-L-alanyl-D-glutamate--2,6-diaminopimelate ligase [Cardinium endosymbiont of Culicoides punctatus]|uniref:UDP-N-acetylmuramoyl-L-alanyl-D-glutamate--2, 6-diaminopimelate ligase n=1 Tax=Cardinium endosymbiont of Culicoides punctatus TaxID=2304601 RepID=UPI001058436B|nr:UDP-N-acetylmuramoyl-L-alanyl-D-glutamate--2,6-diaminopimelate ligase [Cardinium endosymbiont of Culicoides punctatus]TDG95693.1 UDP-N-acetylmuramoyl-L-alanyl-D-glutamate--2,6-diaminopimelate ligase [Cardinium endosymbiont of Culicoides punctatus]
MKTLETLLVGLTVRKILGPTDISIAKICFSSQQVEANSCFVAIAGTQVDGHTYISDAITAGATAVVCEILPEPSQINSSVTYIMVQTTPIALGMMASNFYDHPSQKLKIIAVTGTNGKTSVVHLLYNMVVKMGYKAGMLSTIHNKILDIIYPSSHTTPDTLQLHALLYQMVEAGCQYCFMEASSHAIVQERLAGLTIMGAIFTNITHEHLDYHLNFARYIQAKKKLFDHLPKDAFALVNKQDKNSTIMLQNCKAQKYTYSLQHLADFRAKIITNTLDGLELEIDGKQVWFQLLGACNASNILAAYGVSQLLGLDSQASLVALSAISPILGRMNKVNNKKQQEIIIDYAHTPDAVEKLMATLRDMLTRNSRLISVMGCGGNRDNKKRAMIGKILALHSDISIFTSDNPRDEDPQDIIQSMEEGVPLATRQKILSIVDRASAIKTACLLATANDVVLLIGKGHQHYEEIKGVKYYFCEEQIVQEILCDSLDTVSLMRN